MDEHGETLSVVVPVYGCANCLVELHKRLEAVISRLGVVDWELILVDDRSTDGSWDRALELTQRDPHVRCARLSRNFGQHAAITAGLQMARGSWTVVMDCDLQEPPEEIPRLLEVARQGYHVVLTRREERAHHVWRRFTGQIYFAIRRRLLKSNLEPETGSFSLLSRKAVDAYCVLNDVDRSYLMLIDWIGLSRTTLIVEHRGRADGGPSSYSLRQLFKVAVDGVFFQTTALLRWIVTIGFLIAGCALLFAVAVVYANVSGSPLPGWTSIVTLTLTMSSVIILSVGVSALYLGKVFEQVKGRPLYLIDEIVEGRRPAPQHEHAGQVAIRDGRDD
jgi:glycosyltransferase involved in cell wall biosynthesis